MTEISQPANPEYKRVSGKPIAVVLAALFIGAALVKWWPDDTRAIRRQLDAVADGLSVPPDESDLSRTARLTDLKSYLVPEARARFGGRDIASRDELMKVAEGYTPPAGGIFVEFADEQTTIAGNGTARVALNARISLRDPATGQTTVSERPATVDFVKRDGDWLVTAAESPEPQPVR